jgi:hypothetical protein
MGASTATPPENVVEVRERASAEMGIPPDPPADTVRPTERTASPFPLDVLICILALLEWESLVCLTRVSRLFRALVWRCHYGLWTCDVDIDHLITLSNAADRTLDERVVQQHTEKLLHSRYVHAL